MKKGIFNVGNDGSVNTDSGVFIGNCCEDFKEYEEKGSSVVQLAKLFISNFKKPVDKR